MTILALCNFTEISQEVSSYLERTSSGVIRTWVDGGYQFIQLTKSPHGLFRSRIWLRELRVYRYSYRLGGVRVENHEIMLGIECTLFFEENPYTFDNLEGLAYRLGRKQEHSTYIGSIGSQSIIARVGKVRWRYINIFNLKSI